MYQSEECSTEGDFDDLPGRRHVRAGRAVRGPRDPDLGVTARPGPEPAARSKGEPARGGGRARPGPLPRKRPHPVGAPLRRGAPTGPSAASAGFGGSPRSTGCGAHSAGSLGAPTARRRGRAGLHSFTAPGEPPTRSAQPTPRRRGRPARSASPRQASQRLAQLDRGVGSHAHRARRAPARLAAVPSAASPHQASHQPTQLNPRPVGGGRPTRPASPRQASHQPARLNPRPTRSLTCYSSAVSTGPDVDCAVIPARRHLVPVTHPSTSRGKPMPSTSSPAAHARRLHPTGRHPPTPPEWLRSGQPPPVVRCRRPAASVVRLRATSSAPCPEITSNET